MAVARPLNDRELQATVLPSTLMQGLCFLVPLAMVIAMSFQVTRQFLLVWTWDFDTWADVVSRSYYWTTLWRTVVMSAATVALCLLIALPMTYCLVTRLKAWDTHIKLLIVFAFLTDLVLKTYGWVLVLDQEGVLNVALRATGLVAADFDHGLIFTEAAALFGMVVNLLPFMIFTLYLSLSAVDRDLVLAAYDAGASRWRAFRTVTLPLCRPGIWAGSVFVFILSMGSLLEERVLGGGTAPMMGALIRQTFETRVNWPLGAALTLVLVATTVIIIAAFTRIYRAQRGARRFQRKRKPISRPKARQIEHREPIERRSAERHGSNVMGRLIDRRGVPLILYGAVFVTLMLFYVPILTLIAFSVRAGRHLVLPFDGVTLEWYRSLLADRDFHDALINSLTVAGIVTGIATALGTLLAIGLLKFSFRFRPIAAVINLTPILVPQLLLGIVLLIWFSVLGNWFGFRLGLLTIITGHIIYITPFAALVVGVQYAAIDTDLERAARDAGASTWQVYRDVTLPLLWPGIFSAAIFAFLLSWSNFYISFNLAGTTSMLPTFVYAGLAFNSSPAQPAIATLILVPMIVLVLLAEIVRRRAVASVRSAVPETARGLTPQAAAG